MHTSLWDLAEQKRQYPPLDKDLTVDVAVIGGGITGITAAYLLKQAGATVALLERDRIGSGDTYGTTAHLTYVTDTRLSKLARSLGKDQARATWEAGAAALRKIDEIVRAETLDCDFERVPGYLHAPLDHNKPADFEGFRQEAALAQELGFAASFVRSVPVINRSGICFEDQARFHPLKYLSGLAEKLQNQGARICEQTPVREVTPSLVVRAGEHKVSCGNVVMATHLPLFGVTGLIRSTILQTKLAAYNSYAVAGRVPAGSVPAALFWDTSEPYFYLRTHPGKDFDYVILGGADHKTGQNEDTAGCFAQLKKVLQDLLPGAQPDAEWSGQVLETHDGLPYIGEVGQRLFAATGFAGNGMTFGTLGGMMACDAIRQNRNPWADLFGPDRTTLSSAWNYAKENVDYPYYMLKDRISGSDNRRLEELKPNEGAILQRGGHRFAAYRDSEGNLSLLSPVCTHMGCLVHWNNAEQTWDCPCHGSRFRAKGEVLAGPATKPLKHVEAVLIKSRAESEVAEASGGGEM